jgi:3-oxoacyl-[acyl-carrier-protein] synthase III
VSAALVGCASAFPAHVVDNAFFAGAVNGTRSMFAGTVSRRHLGDDETASELIAQASRTLLDRHGLAPEELGAIFTNVSVTDEAFYGCGADVKRRLGARTDRIVDLHNGGCVSFIQMLELAQLMIDAGQIATALICNAQTAAGRIFSLPQNRVRPEAAIPGDGCGVALVRGDGPGRVLALSTRCHEEHADDMRTTRDCGTPFWKPSENALRLDFAPERITTIIERGTTLVPAVIREVCDRAGREPHDIDALITNQPNMLFMNSWHESLGIDSVRHIHTFPEYANLFGAALPVNLERALRVGAIRDGSLVCLAGFSHAGDYTAAALIEWREPD